MQLIEQLSRRIAGEESYFRQYLLKEDVARLEQLMALPLGPGLDAFIAAGSKLGWTPDDRRTHELGATLVPLLEAIHALRGAPTGADRSTLDATVIERWSALDKERIDKFAGCLSRVPQIET